MVKALAWWLCLPLLLSVSPLFAGVEYGGESGDIRVRLVAHRHTTLSAEMPGVIRQLGFREGQAFSRGAVLVEFDCNLKRAQMAKAEAVLASAQTVLEGNRRLAGLNSVGEVELQRSAAEVRSAQADVDYHRELIRQCRLLAPWDGIAGEQEVRELQFVQPGQPLMEIVDARALELEFIVPTRWLSWLGPGHAFEVLIEDTGKRYPAVVMRTAAQADPVSQSIKVLARIEGAHPELIPGMSGWVALSDHSPAGPVDGAEY